MASLFSPHLKRLFRYVRPYSFRLGFGILMMAAMAVAEGIVALMIHPAVDYVLDPSVVTTALPLVTLPWNKHSIYLNHYFLRASTTSGRSSRFRC